MRILIDYSILGAKSVGFSTAARNVDDEELSHSSLSFQSEKEKEDWPIPRPQKVFKQQTNKNLQSFETEETSKLTTQELQRLVLIEQLKTTRIQRQFYEQAIWKASKQPNASHEDNSYIITQLN